MPVKNLYDAVRELDSDQAKAQVIVALPSKSRVPEDLVDLAVNYYENRGNLLHATLAACNGKDKKKATQLYDRAISALKADEHWGHMGLLAEKCGLFEEAIDYYLKYDGYIGFVRSGHIRHEGANPM